MRRNVFKLILGTLITLGVLFFAVVILVRYFFPSETVRQELEVALSQQLRVAVSIQSLDFDLLKGL